MMVSTVVLKALCCAVRAYNGKKQSYISLAIGLHRPSKF